MNDINKIIEKKLKEIAYNTLKSKKTEPQPNIAEEKINDVYMSIIESKNFNKDSYNTKELSKIFFNTPVSKLLYDMSPTFFTSQFVEQLKNILPPHAEYKKLPANKKKEIQIKLWNLSQTEFEWKSYSKRVKREAHIPYYFKKQFKLFQQEWESYAFPNKDKLKKQRVHINFFSYKTEKFLRFIFEKLIETDSFRAIDNVLSLSDYDYSIIIKEYVLTDFIFTDILRLCVKLAHDNLFNYKKKSKVNIYYSDTALVVNYHELRSHYQLVLAMNLINAALNYCVEKKKINTDVLELSKPIQTFMYTRIPQFGTKQHTEWGIHCDNTENILNLFLKCEVFTNVVMEKKYDYVSMQHIKVKKLILPSYLESEIYTKPLKFPYITKPKKIKMSDVNDLIKPLVSGERSIVISKELVNSLNYSAFKKYKISESFLEAAMYFAMSKIKIDIGFPRNADIYDEEDKYQRMNTYKTRGWTFLLTNHYKNTILGNTSVAIKNFTGLLKLSGSTTMESMQYLLTEKQYIKLHTTKMEAKFALTSISMANWLLHYPLYITDKMCVRLRFYPVEHWISRTSGVLKHLLCDYKAIKITYKGLVNLILAYYATNEVLRSRFIVFIKQFNLLEFQNKKMLYEFFHSNIIDFTLIKKNTLYFMHLHMELLKTEKNNKTDVNVEIDQTASGIVFLSLLLRDFKMAKSANLICSEKNCPYTLVMSHFESFALNSMDNLSYTAIDFLKSNRKLHKYALMCFTYSQKYKGRIEDFRDLWVDTYKRYPSTSENATLNEFALKYEDFIESIFPRTKRKLQLLLNAVELTANTSGRTTIATLDGEFITWSFYKTEKVVRHKFDPSSMKSCTYRSSVISSNQTIDLKSHKTKFLSYLIHSIDAAVLRMVIRYFAEKKNYHINHLHDCIIIHPNYVDDFYFIINEIYHSEDMYNLAEKLVFDTMKTSVSFKSDELLAIKKEYLSLCDDFKENMNFDPRNIYHFED